MSALTDRLKLILTPVSEVTKTFLTWRTEMSGETDSNLIKIDTAIGDLIDNKQDKLTGSEGQYAGFDSQGNLVATDMVVEDNVQPDLSVNDPTDSAYVKNRTHWTETISTSVTLDNSGVLVDADTPYCLYKLSDIVVTDGEMLVGGTVSMYNGVAKWTMDRFATYSVDPDNSYIRAYMNGYDVALVSTTAKAFNAYIGSDILSENGTYLLWNYISDASETGIAVDISTGELVNKVPFGYLPRLGVGESTASKEFAIGEATVTAGVGAEIFNDYANNIATGVNSHAEGNNTTASGDYSHAEGNQTEASAYGSHAEGQSSVASAWYSHAEGNGTTASGNYSHAEGDRTTASGVASHAEGQGTTASRYAHAEGVNTTANGLMSHAEGYETTVDGNFGSHAEGYYTIASGANQHVQGKYNVTDTESEYAHIVGNGASEDARSNAHTLDWSGNAWFAGDVYVGGTGQDDGNAVKLLRSDEAGTAGKIVSGTEYTIGTETVIADEGAEIFNDYAQNKAVGIYAHAEGNNTKASGEISHAEGMSTTASGSGSHSEGSHTIASGGGSHAEGFYTTASGEYSHAEGRDTKSIGNYSHAEGCGTTASSDSQHVQGEYNLEDSAGKYVHIVGNGTSDTIRSNAHTLDRDGNAWFRGDVYVSGDSQDDENAIKLAKEGHTHTYSWEEITDKPSSFGAGEKVTGTEYTIDGESVIAELGAEVFNSYNTNVAVGSYSHAEGGHTTAFGFGSHAEGNQTTASGTASHAEGNTTTASGDHSHAENQNTIASGGGSHAEGFYTTASGEYSHAEGYWTAASGYSSHVEGNFTIASSSYQHVQGKYNLEDSANEYAHIVGNGTNVSARSNAHTLDWNGNAWFAGSMEGTALILNSSVAGSTKRFRITVDDDGVLTAMPYTG